MNSPRAKRHSLDWPKNLPGALKDGAQTELALRPCSAVELGWVSFGQFVCAGVRAREAPEETVHRRPGFWPLQRTPLSPPRVLARRLQKGKMLQKRTLKLTPSDCSITFKSVSTVGLSLRLCVRMPCPLRQEASRWVF